MEDQRADGSRMMTNNTNLCCSRPRGERKETRKAAVTREGRGWNGPCHKCVVSWSRSSTYSKTASRPSCRISVDRDCASYRRQWEKKPVDCSRQGNDEAPSKRLKPSTKFNPFVGWCSCRCVRRIAWWHRGVRAAAGLPADTGMGWGLSGSRCR